MGKLDAQFNYIMTGILQIKQKKKKKIQQDALKYTK